ncbi:hypothetical protein QBC36DRAFT_296142 [Triangularia setosa]|uniref:Uncharacterized protein n=1 Tax=Triangularia setosa TaxID=2587417 RepID=A0AAN6VXK7_9PEZI|nr:hypothetical protein QBC36DRAFT_296142 [Podospora setosa]
MSIDLNKLLIASSKTSVFLTSPDDWESFDYALQFQATERLWPYLNPINRLPFSEEPSYPNINDSKYTKECASVMRYEAEREAYKAYKAQLKEHLARAQREISASSTTERGDEAISPAETILILPEEVQEPVYTDADLTGAAALLYAFDTKSYAYREAKYKTLIDDCRSLMTWMTKSMSAELWNIHCTGQQGIVNAYDAIRNTMIPDVDEYRMKHQDKLREHVFALKAANSPKKVADSVPNKSIQFNSGPELN